MTSVLSLEHCKMLKVDEDTTYSYVSIPAAGKNYTILFLHGFPSSSYDWRYQVSQLSQAGYGIVAPDLLGYGDTDKPEGLENYSLKRMSSHLIDILEAEGVNKVIGIGHDVGSTLLSCLWNYHPSYFIGLVFLTVGYVAPGDRRDVDAINEATQKSLGYPIFGYWKFFGAGDAVQLINENPKSMSSLLYPPDPALWREHMAPLGAARAWITAGRIAPLPTWLTEEENEIPDRIFARDGYQGPLNWYKHIIAGINNEDEANVPEGNKFIVVPTLLVTSKNDPIALAAMMEQRTRGWARGPIKVVEIDCGHWVQLEGRVELGQALREWLQTFDSKE